MATLKIVLSVLFIIVSLVITIVILFEEGKSRRTWHYHPELLIHIGARTRDVQGKDVWLKQQLYVLFFSLLFQLL